jgi:hypothetical protein
LRLALLISLIALTACAITAPPLSAKLNSFQADVCSAIVSLASSCANRINASATSSLRKVVASTIDKNPRS